MESKELAIRLARALDAKKAVNVHILAVEDLTTVTEYFVIATGMSTTHVGALADEAEFQLDREGVKVLRTEGHDGKRWVLLDYAQRHRPCLYPGGPRLLRPRAPLGRCHGCARQRVDAGRRCGRAVKMRNGFPLGGSCQRPRPLTDEGQPCGSL